MVATKPMSHINIRFTRSDSEIELQRKILKRRNTPRIIIYEWHKENRK